tara:strand:+ start:653 stop:823 length:171 start_codon:yes stop_codon:yes gene_type:complete
MPEFFQFLGVLACIAAVVWGMTFLVDLHWPSFFVGVFGAGIPLLIGFGVYLGKMFR